MEDFCPTMQSCNIMELLPFFLDTLVDTPELNITPTMLLNELTMPMQHRIDQLTKPTRKRRITTSGKTFMRTPDIVVFQNFEEYQPYKINLTFTNTKLSPKSLKLQVASKSPFFKVVLPTNTLDFNKVAPGIPYVTTIIFTPAEMRDYVGSLICSTNDETFNVPLYGIGTRPLLKIPDEIIMNPTAIRVTSQKSILLINLSNKPGQCLIKIEEPFHVTPKKLILGPRLSEELQISCTPKISKNSYSLLVIQCEDLLLKVPVRCCIEEANITFQKLTVDFFEVFVGLQNYKTITVFNDSPYTINFTWKLLPSIKEDVERIKKVIENMACMTELEKTKYNKLVYHQLIIPEQHEQILDYTFQEYAAHINDEFKLTYQNEAFSIIPLEGQILPHQSFDYNIIFAPTKNKVYMSTAYLDVTGRNERFQLYISGIGKGPCVVFNVDKLNTGTIFLEAVHEYQVVVKNDGCIPATVVFQERKTEFGGTIRCNPPFQHIDKAEACKAFVVSFSSPLQGPFVERVYFKIKESQELIYFLIMGNVVCPLLIPDIEKLDFGKIAFGSEVTKQVVLTNPSQVPIDFHVKMSHINYNVMSNGERKADFTYEPSEGTVAPYGSVTIEIKLLTNIIASVYETMIIGMYGSDVYTIKIPCTYTCLIPTLVCEPHDIYITFCFLNFVYNRKLTFTNITDLTGHLQYAPLEDPTNMQLTLSPTEIDVRPRDSFEVDLTITTDVLGLHEYPLVFKMVGQEKPTTYCTLKCNGQGPVVSYFPDDINFGQVHLLQTAVKQMSFINDSPIKAKLFLSSNNTSVVQLPIEELDLFPECETAVDVICFLTEDGKFECQIFVDVENGENIVINVTGEGIGYPIQCEPRLDPVYDLGSHLTYLTNKLPVTISNLGRKIFRIYFSRNSTMKSVKDLIPEIEVGIPQNAIMWVEPSYMELGENCSEQIYIYARSKNPHYYEESFHMYATIDVTPKANSFQLVIPIMSALFKVKFIVPVMSFSTQHLKFVELHVPEIKIPGCELKDEQIPLESISTREVVIRNEVEIPLMLVIHTTEDFVIKTDIEVFEDTINQKLEVGSEFTLTIEFHPRHYHKRYVKYTGKLTVNIPEYPKTESIVLTGEMCFPTVKFLPDNLDFGCLEYGSTSVRRIIIQNITFLPVMYTLELLSDTFQLQKLMKGAIGSSHRLQLESETSETESEPDKTPPRSVYDEHSIELAFTDADLSDQSGTEVKTENQSELLNVESRLSAYGKSLSKSEEDVLSSKSQDDFQPFSPERMKRITKTILYNFFYTRYDENVSLNEIEDRDFWSTMKHPNAQSENTLRNILTLEPWQGYLRPYEYCLINVHFKPPSNSIVTGSAICRVEGGEKTPIHFRGSCSKILYSFDRTLIDVGRKLFCEVMETTITLTNDGYYEFPVVVRCNDDEIFSNKKIQPKWLNIEPRHYFLRFGKSVTFKVTYFPGVTGAFEENIIFDIAYLEPEIVTLKGFAIFTQVVINIPRYDYFKKNSELPYRGIANVNERYLLSELPRRRTANMIKWERYSRSSVTSRISSVSDDVNDIRLRCLEEHGWCIIRKGEPVPTLADLDLATERIMLNDHLLEHYDELKKHSITRKIKIIPGFKVPPYYLCFGNVTVDCSIVYTLLITNVGPEPTTVKILKSNLSSLCSNDVFIEYRPGVIQAGESSVMHVIMKPSLKISTAHDYDDKCIRDTMFLAVTHGATIPIIITATVAMPRFGFSSKCVDFGMVKVGNAFRQTVAIMNRGCLPCIWETDVRSLNEMRPSYYVIPSKGQIMGFEQSVMNIYFVPERKGFYMAEVIVHVQGSPKQVKLKLCGDGFQPTLVFKDANMKFPPCIPYTSKSIDLYIQNVSTYPIEFCFSDFEKQYDEEKLLIELFLNYHNLRMVFIPERELGGKTPELFLSTYEMLANEVRKLFKEQRPEEDDDVDVLADMTQLQVIDLINKHMNSLIVQKVTNDKPENSTDIYIPENKYIEGLAIIDPPQLIEGQAEKKGACIIFYGCEYTEYVRASVRTAKALQMDSYSIDKLIYEELIDGKSPAAELINNIINEVLASSDEEIELSDCDDDYDILEKRVTLIMNNSKLLMKKKSGKFAEEESSKYSKSLSKSNYTATFLSVNPEIYKDILKSKLDKHTPALVIESLNSVFICNPLLALECLLHALGNLRYIKVVLLSLTLNEYIYNKAKLILEEELLEEPRSKIKELNREESKRVKSAEKSLLALSNKGNKTKRVASAATVMSFEQKLEQKVQVLFTETPKEVKHSFYQFDHLLIEIHDVCETWDRRHCVLAFVSQNNENREEKTEKHEKREEKKPKIKSVTGLLKFTNVLSYNDLSNIGVPLMIVNNAVNKGNNELLDSIIETLQQDNDLTEELTRIKCPAVTKVEESCFMYSVVKKIPRYNKNLSDVFKLCSAVTPPETIVERYSHASETSMSYAKLKAKKGRKKVDMAKSEVSIPSRSKQPIPLLNSRTVISPGEILKYEINFNPQSLGSFTHRYRLEIIGIKSSLFLKCTAKSQLPKLDYKPETMFPICLATQADKDIGDHFVYIKDLEIFDFGTLIISGTRPAPYSTSITLKTISKIPCEVWVQLAPNSEFKIDSSSFDIAPDAKVDLQISLIPRRKGTIESVLYIVIRNNPMVYRLNLIAEVVPLDFGIVPKALNFDKIPLDATTKQYIKLSNPTSISLKWRFLKYEWALKIYKISKLRGEIKMFSLDRVEFEFKPTKEEVYPPRAIEIQIFDPLCSEEFPLCTEQIFLQSEAVEYIINCVDRVDLGELKGRKDYHFPLRLSNHGNTSVSVLLEKVIHPIKSMNFKVVHNFSSNINTEILNPNKSSGIIIKCNPQEEMDFQDVPVFSCKILDPNKPLNIIKAFQIKFSATVILSRFSVSPSSEVVHFGALEVCNKRTQILNMKNTGRTMFNFVITHKELESIDTIPVPDKQTSKTQSKESRPGHSKSALRLKASELYVPGFLIGPCRGHLEIGQNTDITLTFQPTTIGAYRETILIKISEPAKEYMNGKEITMCGEAAEPWIEFKDVTRIFKEHYIVNVKEDLQVPNDIGTHIYYVISKNTLYFENVCVKKECKANLYLQNVGKLIASVSTKIHNSNNFTVYPTQLSIDPYLIEVLTVTFKPDSINTFDSKLEIMLSSQTNNFEVNLQGRSYLPQIKLSELPTSPGNDNAYKYVFPPTFVDEIASQRVMITNVGVFDCQFIIDNIDGGNKMFFIYHGENLPSFKNNLTPKENNLISASYKINLKRLESTYIHLIFKPKEEMLVKSMITIHVVDNPFEIFRIEVYGQSFKNDLHIDSLKTINPKGWGVSNKAVAYVLNFGHTPLKWIQLKKFSIVNKSPDTLFRFEFIYDIESLKFVPRVGHLKPRSSKAILAVNISSGPSTITKEPINLQYSSITYLNEEQPNISWDERQQMLSWLESGIATDETATIQQFFRNCIDTATELFVSSEECDKDKVTGMLRSILDRDEPEVIYTAEDMSNIEIQYSITSDYAQYSTAATKIEFLNALVKERYTSVFSVKNTGKVPLNIVWKVVFDESTSKHPSRSTKDNDEIGTRCSLDTCTSTLSGESMLSDKYLTHPDIFQIEPKKTKISMKGTAEFTVSFTPLVAAQYRAFLVSDIESLHPDLRNIEILMLADSDIPHYYFEMEQTEYLTKSKLEYSSKNIDQSWKVLEIQAVGIGVTVYKSFNILNTSYTDINFTLEPEELNTLSYFTCKTPCGLIKRGKKLQITFGFITNELGTFEEVYIFKTDHKDTTDFVQTKILIVGVCKSPKVYFKAAHINMSPTLLGIPTQETIYLQSEENEELNFKIIKESLYSLISQSQMQKLKINPKSGRIPAHSVVPLQLTYKAEVIGDSFFSIKCLIDKMIYPLNLNISAKCLQVDCKVSYINQNEDEITLDPNNENLINLGKIGIKSKLVVPFVISNVGKTGFYYNWNFKIIDIRHLINITPPKEKEFIPAGSSVKRELFIETFKKYNLKDFQIKLEISYGPVYNIKLYVAAEYAMCRLSFCNYNFGNCLIQKSYTKNYSTILTARNYEPNPIKLDLLFQPNENLTVDYKSDLLPPNATISIPFYFHPRKEGRYEFQVDFAINCVKRPIKVTGAGVKVNLQMKNPKDKFINMGEVKYGHSKTIPLYVINRTPVQMDVTLVFSDDYPREKKVFEILKPEITVPIVPVEMYSSDFNKFTGRESKQPEEVKTSLPRNEPQQVQQLDSQKPYFLIEPSDPVKMQYNKKYEYLVTFQPCTRQENYCQKIFYKVQDHIAPLCLVKGKCIVSEFYLDKEVLNFTDVLIDTEMVKNVLLRNTGDVPIRFKWNDSNLQHFKAAPSEGYVSPKTDIKISFTFKAVCLKLQVYKKCICLINNKHQLELTLVANTVQKPAPIATITFSCPVKQKITQMIDIENKTYTMWNLHPKVTNSNFIVPPEITVEPKTKLPVPVEYFPKKLRNEEGFFSFSLPEEEILYKFIGIPLPPLPENKFNLEIRCKQNYSHVLKVYNWTDIKQCFNVETKLMSQPTTKTLFKTSGLDMITLLPGESTGYKWNIYVLNEGVYDLQVIFEDKNTKECLFYEISVKAIAPEPIITKKMSTSVREPITTEIKIHNPVDIPVDYFLTSPCNELTFKNYLHLEPYSKTTLEVVYFPVKHGEFITNIEAKCEELGSFVYTFNLIASLPEPVKLIKFVSELGEKALITVDLQNTFNRVMEISVKCENIEFYCDKYSKVIPPGENFTIPVIFEPSNLGVVESKLFVSSAVSGPYIYQLLGECIMPTPKGPYFIKPGGNVYIPFYNPFNETQEFTYYLDSKLFDLKISNEEIKAKKHTKIIVACPNLPKSHQDLTCNQSGRLVVSCSNIKWSYYIQTE